MRARKPLEQEGSLDLLLDTVCNAFGGIVFITLLVCILPSTLTENASSSTQASAAEIFELQRARETLSLKEKVLPVLEQAAQNFANPEQEKELSELAELKEREREAIEVSELLSSREADIDRRIKGARLQVERLKAIRQRLRTGLNQIEEGKQSRRDVRFTRLPRLRKVNRNNFFIVLSGGRAYPVRRPGDRTLQYQFNEVDFEVKNLGETKSFTPLPGKGSAIGEWLRAPDEALHLLGQVPRELYLIHLIVFPDSLQHFSPVRNFFTSRCYDYNWSPLADGRPLLLVAATGPMDAQ